MRTPGQMVDTIAPSLGGFSSVLYDLTIERLSRDVVSLPVESSGDIF